MTATLPALNLMAYRLGQNDAFLRVFAPIDGIQPPPLAVPLALRLLRRLWMQYREDRGLEGPASLISNENLLPRAHFLAALHEFGDLDGANRILAQAVDQLQKILPPEDRVVEFTDTHSDDDHELLHAVEMALCTSARDNGDTPDRRLHQLLKAFKYSTDTDAASLPHNTPCWALNLLTALNPLSLGISSIPLPYPGLYSREMFRADRSEAWCDHALVMSVIQSAEIVMAETLDLQAATNQFDDAFSARRSTGRIDDVYHLLSGFGQLTATQIARGVGMTEPGARKLLAQLGQAGFAYKVGSGAYWSSTLKFRIGPPQHHWLRHSDCDWLRDREVSTLMDMEAVNLVAF